MSFATDLDHAIVTSVPKEICSSAPAAGGQRAPIEEGEKKPYPACWVTLDSVIKRTLSGLAIMDGVGWVGMQYSTIPA
jgi:hypothetical protein